MTNILLMLSLITVVAPSAFASAKGKVVPLSLEESALKWKGTKVTGAHNGSVRLKSGSVKISGKHVTGGEFEVDMASIANEDLSGGTADKLVGHLKSDDFFNVEKYPTAKFVITKVTPLKKKAEDGSDHTVTGKLTIRDKTESVSFPATIKVGAAAATAKGTVKVDRTKWDVKYGSGKFFKGLGDKMIHDEFSVDLVLKAPLEPKK